MHKDDRKITTQKNMGHNMIFLGLDLKKNATVFSARYAIARSSVRLSVRHTGGSVKDG